MGVNFNGYINEFFIRVNEGSQNMQFKRTNIVRILDSTPRVTN